MKKVENIETFYEEKHTWMPDNLRKEIGHFNVFKLDPFIGKNAKQVPYRKRDYYKITLIIGNGVVQYADKTIEVKKHALVFSNPQIPYSWTQLDKVRTGQFCVFNQTLFHQYGNLDQYSVFQPNGTHVFELTTEQVKTATAVYDRMFDEFNSEYIHKYDVLRNLTFELIHFAMKMHPATSLDKQPVNAAKRISTLFLELLERQFPIDDNHQTMQLRSASDFAEKLNIHVNHLNRAVKETAEKTTSEIIAERILQEAKILLRHSSWNVSEIAYSLGFTEPTHFNNFFKKHTKLSPMKFRVV
ncbi:MAG: helix-turn-helix transcriptional regulator [Saprospiraceae bacterium]|jgi:AraC family transcriptional activator of pobA|nr:helix-turn-helix transcriptional regulator [Saprospiraceae bacterium]MBK7796336.1 helix-turn-helix transcriptional regulator [Saprospiraceae bacterium]